MKKKIIGWLHWLLYGEWKMQIPERKERKIKEKCVTHNLSDSIEERELVATPFIVGGLYDIITKEEKK